MDLSNGKQLDFWLQLRDYVRREDQSQTSLLVGALLLIDIIILGSVLIRVLFLGRSGDVYNILGVVDSVSLFLFLYRPLTHIVRINSEIDSHHEELSKIRIAYALKCAEEPEYLKGGTSQREKYRRLAKVTTLLDMAISHLEKYDPYVRVLGIVVDRKLLYQLLSLVATAVLSGVGTFLNRVQQGLVN